MGWLRGRLIPTVALAAVGFVRAAPAEEPRVVMEPEAHKAWLVKTSRMEGATVNVREAADELARTARRIESGGRIDAMAELMSDLGELNRRVVSAGLAAEVLAK